MKGCTILLVAITYITFVAGKKCSKDQFPCGNGVKCISANWFCDGDDDCGDESDEPRRNTSNAQRGIPCRESDHDREICMLPEDLISQKETFCKGNPHCNDDEFACDDGSKCLPSYDFCDGNAECKDGSDEVRRNISSPDSLNGLPCRRTSHVCMLPDHQLSKKPSLCIQDPDCSDDEFLCADGTKCISFSDFCDGSEDCSDGSDEIKANSSDSGIPCRPHDTYICLLPERDIAKKDKFCKKNIECDDNQFKCADGNKCLPGYDFCDGSKECEDGSDEIERNLTLDATQPGIPCRRNEKICMFPEDGGITIRKNICKKKIDCEEDEFSCMDGTACIAKTDFCNGNKDCSDGSDEVLFKIDSPITGTRCRQKNLICVLPLSQSDKDKTFCKKDVLCAADEFACLDGTECLPKAKFCDGTAHCSDKSDEIKSFHPDSNVTGIACRQTKYLCLLHQNETDKQDRLCKKAPKCGLNEFACADGLQCVLAERFCDGKIDCRDGSDEMKRNRSANKDVDAVPCRRDVGVCWLPKAQQKKRNTLCKKAPKCGKNEFACLDGTLCLPAEAFCNGTAECYDGSDEMKTGSDDPAIKDGLRCRQDRYKCILPANQKTKKDNFCKKKFQCDKDQYECLDGSECIPSWWFCDGYADCGDGSDEIPIGSTSEGMACRRFRNTCLLPQSRTDQKLTLCKKPVE